MEGWIKVYRQILDNPIMTKASYLAVWITLLLMANHKDNVFIFNEKNKEIKRGQLITSRKSIAEVLFISESEVYRIIQYLTKNKYIEQQTYNKYTLITIVKYEKYQGENGDVEQQKNNKRTAKEQPVNTNKNVKNNNKDIALYLVDVWNRNSKITAKYDAYLFKVIYSTIEKYDALTIESAIENYSTLLKDRSFKIDNKTMNDFLKWSIDYFIDLEVAKEKFGKFVKKEEKDSEYKVIN